MSKKAKAAVKIESDNPITTNRCYVIVAREGGKALSVHDRRTKARGARAILGYNNVTIERLKTAYAKRKYANVFAS